MEIIKLSDVSKKFKNKLLYENVNLTVNEGECVGIVGSNGSGKSVLFKLISGLENSDTGSVFVNGAAVGGNRDFPSNIGLFVNQPGYIEYYDGFTNLKLLAEIQNKISDEKIRESMEAIGLNPNDKTKVKNYSAGMKQKLGITQAIMENQEIILLDEPFNALDFQTNADVLKILKKLKEEKKTILLTSHQHEYLEKLCDKLYIILNTRIVEFDEEIKKKYFTI